jgi:hypothetical protein
LAHSTSRRARPCDGARDPLAGAAPGARPRRCRERIFPTTLTIDDPAVADEASLPTIIHQRHGSTDTDPAFRETDINAEYDKRITDHLGVAVNGGYTILDKIGQKSAPGFSNLNTTLKYQFLQNGPHELLMSAGVIRSWGGTGTNRIGASATGSTTPTIYFGKGFGDLPDAVRWLQPFAITGTFGYQFQDVPTSTALSIDPDSGAASLQTAHNPDLLVWGASLQYSIPYLQENIKDFGLPKFLGRLTPLVELAYTSPATRSNGVLTQGTIAPGVIYSGESFQIGAAALIPATKGLNASTGFIVQLHLFLDDIFPTSLGKPIFGGRP